MGVVTHDAAPLHMVGRHSARLRVLQRHKAGGSPDTRNNIITGGHPLRGTSNGEVTWKLHYPLAVSFIDELSKTLQKKTILFKSITIAFCLSLDCII